MNTYNVTLKYEDRKVGSEGRTIKVDASSIAGAIGKATRDFVKGLDRKQRFDANKGLQHRGRSRHHRQGRSHSIRRNSRKRVRGHIVRHFQFDDGGRSAAGYQGKTGDCVVRSIAIATGLPYQQIYDLVNGAAVYERTGTRKRGKSNARTGVYKTSIKRVMKSLGWVWTPTMQIGSGCKVHLRADELPSGRLVVSVSKHLTAVIDGVIHDTHDPAVYSSLVSPDLSDCEMR